MAHSKLTQWEVNRVKQAEVLRAMIDEWCQRTLEDAAQ
jgi:hypothetical protein